MNEELNLIIPFETDAGLAFVHAAPLSSEVFDAHYLLISKTFTAIMTEGLSVIAGPRVAGNILRDIAIRSNQWDGANGGSTLLNEMVRLSNVAWPGENGYEQIPLHTLIERKMISDRDRKEVVGAIVFFTVNSAIHRRQVLTGVLDKLTDLWGTRTFSSDITAFIDSLRTSTRAGSTGATGAAA